MTDTAATRPYGVLGRVLGKLNQVPDVIDARRLHGS